MQTAKCWPMQMIRPKLREVRIQFFLEYLDCPFSKMRLSLRFKKVVICYAVFVVCVLDNEKNVVFNGLLSARRASGHMYCTIYTIGLCFGERVRVLGIKRSGRKKSQSMRETCNALDFFRAGTARNHVTVLGSTWADADILGSVKERRTVWLP